MVAYCFFLVAAAPASLLTDRLADRIQGLSLQGVDGSLFAGTASRVSVKGYSVGPVSWHFRPLGLLLGRAEYRIDLQDPDSTGSGVVGMTLSGTLHGGAIDVSFAPEHLVNRFSPLILQTSGDMRLVIDEIELSEQQLTGLDGNLSWNGAGISQPLEMVLDKLEMKLDSESDRLIGTIVEGGRLGLTGNIVLMPNNRYTVDLALRPGSDVPAETISLLQNVAKARPDGSYHMRQSGSLQSR